MMDDYGLYPREEPFDPLGVMLFKALQVIAFLFFLALLAVAPDAKEGKIDSKAEFIITMDWPDNHPDDLDLPPRKEKKKSLWNKLSGRR